MRMVWRGPWWWDRWMKQPNPMWYGGQSVMFKSDLLPTKFLQVFFPIFPQSLLTSTSLFLSSLRRITYAYSIIFPSGKPIVCFNEPSDSETRSCLLWTSLSLFSFNEFNDKNNSVLFNFRESEKERKGNSKIPFSSSNPLSPKKYKTIQKGWIFNIFNELNKTSAQSFCVIIPQVQKD